MYEKIDFLVTEEEKKIKKRLRKMLHYMSLFQALL